MTTLEQYGRLQNLEAVKSDIENGAKFNGIVYGENKGSKYVIIFVYVDGKKRYIKEVEKADTEIVKIEVAEYLEVAPIASKQNSWVVDGKSVNNNLTYAEMYEKYGMDFE